MGPFLFVKVMKVPRQTLWRRGLKNDSTFPAFAVTSAIIVQIQSVPVKDIKKERTRKGGDFTKVLDLNAAFF